MLKPIAPNEAVPCAECGWTNYPQPERAASSSNRSLVDGYSLRRLRVGAERKTDGPGGEPNARALQRDPSPTYGL